MATYDVEELNIKISPPFPQVPDDDVRQICTEVRQKNWDKAKELLIKATEPKFAIALGFTISTMEVCSFSRELWPYRMNDPAFAVTRKLLEMGLWEGVGEILQHDLPANLHTFVVLKTAQHADCHSFRAFILPYCSDDEVCSALSTLATRVPDHDLSAVIMSAFTLDHLHRLLKQSVSRGQWDVVGAVLDRGVDQTLETWAVKEARRKASERDFFVHVSYHSDDQLDTTLTQLVTLQYWKAVGKILPRPVSASKRRWAVEIASLECSEDVLVSGILPHACDDQLTEVLRHLVLRNQWKAVGYVLQRGVQESSRAWAVTEAISHADAASFVEHVLPHCRDLKVHLEDVLMELVSGRKWRAVGKVLQWGVNRVQLVWVAEQVHLELHKNPLYSSYESKHESVTDELPNYGQDFASLLLSEIFKSSGCFPAGWIPAKWKAVGQMLHLDVNNNIRRLVFEEACRQASSQRHKSILDEQANTEVTKLFMDNIMPHYHGQQAESLLIHPVKHHLYEPAKVIIANGVSDACQNNAVSEAVKQLRRHIMGVNVYKHQYKYCLNFVASFCSEEQAETVVMLAVNHRQWSAAGKMLTGRVSKKSRSWAASEAWQLATCKELATHFLPYISAEQRDTILTPLVVDREWSLVGNVLERGVSDAKHKFAVVRACTQCDQSQFLSCIWPHCNLAQMETYLPHFLRAGVWYLVGEVLKHPIHSDLRHQASLEAIQRADQTEILTCIWPHCEARHMQDCLPHLVRKGLWLCVEQVLRHTDDPALYRWAVDEACKHANFSGYLRCVRVHFSDHDLSSVLAMLLEKNDWNSDLKKWEEVGKILNLGVSDPVRVAAINKAAVMADDDTFAEYFVSHHKSTDHNHSDLLYGLGSRQRWASVVGVLQKGISGGLSQAHYYALVQCMTHVRPDYYIEHVLKYFSNETLGRLHERTFSGFIGMDFHVLEVVTAFILQRGMDAKCRAMVLERAFRGIRDIQFSTAILPLCSEEELKSLLPKTIESGMWNSVTSILDRGVSDNTLRQMVDQTFAQFEKQKYYSERDDKRLLTVLPFCSEDLLESILEKSLSTYRWSVVGKILQIGVDESLHRRCVERACAKAGEQYFLQHILPYCRDDQLDQVIDAFLGTNRHFAVLKIFQRRCLRAENLHKAVESLCGILKSHHMMTYAGSFCAYQLYSDYEWKCMSNSSEYRHDGKHRESESKENCILLSVLQHCCESHVSDLLDAFIAREQWKCMCLVLRRGVGEEQRRSAVAQAVQKLSNTLVVKEDRRLFLTQVVPHCAPGELDSDDIFVRLVQHDYNYFQLQYKFHHIGQFVRIGVSERKLLWAAKEALERRNGHELLLYCNESQVCSVISQLVKSAKSSEIIVQIFKYIVIVSDATCAEFTQMAVSNTRNMPKYSSSSHSESGLEKQMKLFLGDCPDDTKEVILDVLLEHEQWNYVHIALNSQVSEHTRKRVIEAAVELASPEDLLKYLHVHLSDEQVDTVARKIVTESHWRLVSEVFDTLTRNEATKKFVIEKARQQLAKGSLTRNTKINELMRLFSVHALDSEVEKLIMNCSGYFDFQLAACNEWVFKYGLVNAENVHTFDDDELASRVIQYSRRSEISECMLHALVESNQWGTLMNILCDRGLHDADTRWVVKEASKKADRANFWRVNFWRLTTWSGGGFLSFCDDEDLGCALSNLAARNMWDAVQQVLESCRTCLQSLPILEDFIDKLDNETFKHHVLRISAADVLEPGTLVKKVVARGLWSSLKRVMLERVSDEVRQWVVDTACKQSEESVILFLVWGIQSENLLAQLFRHSVSHGLLTCVWYMLRNKTFSVTHDKFEEAIKEVCKQAEDKNIAHFFEQNTMLQFGLNRSDLLRYVLHAILDEVVTRGLWKYVGDVFKLCGTETQDSEEKRIWAVTQVCKNASEEDVIEVIRSNTDLVGHISTIHTDLLQRRMWAALDEVLKHAKHRYNCSVNARRRLTVLRAVDECEDDAMITHHILPHCDNVIQQCVFETLLQKGHWKGVGVLLKHCTPLDLSLAMLAEKACLEADEDSLIQSILPNLNKEIWYHGLKHLVTRKLWKAFGYALQNNSSRSSSRKSRVSFKDIGLDAGYNVCSDYRAQEILSYKKAVDEACDQAEAEDIIKHILPCCISDQLSVVLKAAVERRLWDVTGETLARYHFQRNGEAFTSTHAWAIIETSKLATDKQFMDYILPSCTERYFDVKLFLSPEVNDEHIEQESLENHQGTDHQTANSSLGDPAFPPNCALFHLVRRGLWMSVGVLLQQSLPTECCLQVLLEASQRADDISLSIHILPHVSDSQLNCALQHLVDRGLWQAVGTILGRDIEDCVVVQTLEAAIKRTRDHDYQFFLNMLPLYTKKYVHCALPNLGRSLQLLMDSGLWEVLDNVLDRDIEDSILEQTLQAASKQASDHYFKKHILPHYSSKYVECVLPNLLTRGCSDSASEILKQGISDQQKLSVIDKVDWHSMWIEPSVLMQMCVDDHSFVAVMTRFFKSDNVRGTLQILLPILQEHIIYWAKGDTQREPDGRLMALIKSCHVSLAWERNILEYFYLCNMSIKTGWSKQLNDLLVSTILYCVLSLMQENREVPTSSGDLVSGNSPDLHREIFSDICQSIEICLKQDGRGSGVFGSMKKCSDVVMAKLKAVDMDPLFVFEFLKNGLGVYQTRRNGEQYDNMFVLFMAAFPVVPHIHNIAMHQLFYEVLYYGVIKDAKWNAISQASRSSEVWEHTRRLMFQAAVKHKQWVVVEQWPSHMLYNDQRWWALEEAYKHKQWKVMLALSNMGLTTAEQMLVHNRLVKFADWETAKKIFTRGADVKEMRDMLQIALKERKRGRIHKCSQYGFEIPEQRLSQLATLEQKCMQIHDKFGCRAVGHSKWIPRLFHLFRCSRKQCVEHCVNEAVTNKIWRVVMHLAKTRLSCDQVCSLFPRMVEARQWAVCRVLLEQGASDVLCEQALLKLFSTLLESRQWVLVAMLVDGNITDHSRREILQCALKNREGSVVWQCVRALETPLSLKEREQLFDVAFHRSVWQAVKPLVEVTDSTGIHHRDTAFLEAIRQHLWDVVDYCQLHHADINMKDENGETPLNRAARDDSYTAVEEIVSKGGDPNQLDKHGISVLNRSIRSSSTVKVLVEHLADIHRRTNSHEVENIMSEFSSPLERLIAGNRGEDIAHTLIWCPDQETAVSAMGETALHAACLSMTVCVDSFYYLVARGVDPFALTKDGHSALMYSLQNEDHPQVTLAKCIELGFSTHQPALSANWEAQHMKARQHQLLCEDIEKALRKKKEENTKQKENEEKLLEYVHGLKERKARIDLLTQIDQVLEKDISLVNSELQRPTMSPEQLRYYFERQMRGDYTALFSQSLQMNVHLSDSLALAFKKAFVIAQKHALIGLLIKDEVEWMSTDSLHTEHYLAQENILGFTCRSKFILTCMLYESGALTNGDLRMLTDRLLAVIDYVEIDSIIQTDDHDPFFPEKPPFKQQMRMFRLCTERVQEMASTPRRLMSACRLKISHCLSVRRRAQDVDSLPLSPKEKKYVMFSDLTDPGYGKEWQGHLCVQVARCLKPVFDAPG